MQNILILFMNTNDEFEAVADIILNSLAIEFIKDIDEEIPRQVCHDGSLQLPTTPTTLDAKSFVD